MRITPIIWKEKYIENLERKHDVSIDEVEEVLDTNPFVRKVAKGKVKGVMNQLKEIKLPNENKIQHIQLD